MTEHIILLASGAGRRFGENKLFYPIEGQPLYQRILKNLLEVRKNRKNCRILVVSRYPELRHQAELLGMGATDCPDSHLGISHSIRAGLLALGKLEPEDRVLFVVSDQPYLTVASVCRVLDAPGECACLAWGERPGNPCRFPAALVPELLKLEGDRGGRAVLKGRACTYVQADSPLELMDVDTKVDIM